MKTHEKRFPARGDKNSYYTSSRLNPQGDGAETPVPCTVYRYFARHDRRAI